MKANSQPDDNMDIDYIDNPDHYKTGLMRIGCNEEQALAYSSLFDTNRKKYYRVVDEFIDRLPDGAYICDVGMGTGTDLLYFASKHKDKKFYGVELSKKTLNIAEKFLMQAKISNVEISSNPEWYKEEKFDLIINNCVYEHVGDVDEFTKSISLALKDRGNFVFCVPSHAYWIFWNILYFSFRFLIAGKPDTHSVEHKKMISTLARNNMFLGGRETFGFRPPQDYFVTAKVKHIEELENRNNSLSNIVRKLNLDSALYLNFYYGSKVLKDITDDSEIYGELESIFSRDNGAEIKLSDICLFTQTFFKWQFYLLPKTLIRNFLKRYIHE